MKKAGSALHYAKITVTESGGEERVFYKSGLIAYVDTALFVCLLILFFAFWIKAFIKFIKQIKNGEFENAQNLRRMKNMK
ncbi:MAG: hypothetical protein J6Q68_01835 [Clostridia bacterium]|nr:hypothetical protein [Clostridia bacterium]